MFAYFGKLRNQIDFYQGICWYRRTFRVPGEWRNRRIVLRFEAVNYRARVWLNGQFLGEHRDGFLPFEFEIAEKVTWDEENTWVQPSRGFASHGHGC